MARTIEVHANCVADFARQVHELDHETRANVRALSEGKVWAAINVSPTTDTLRSAFPTDTYGVGGDTNKRGQAGVLFGGWCDRDNLKVAIERSRRLIAARPE